VSALDRPYCEQAEACRAKTPGKHCVACAARSPEAKANKAAAQQRVLADPEVMQRKIAACRIAAATPGRTAAVARAMQAPEARQRHKDGCKAGTARRMARPGERERMQQVGHTAGKANFDASRSVPEIAAKRAAAVRAHHLAWCPKEHWPLNQKLKANGYRLPERQKIIADLVASQSPEAAGRREVAATAAAMLARHEREKAQRY
jgi:hypothetical protein